MYCLGIIPARGGSKRLPGKNIKPMAGKPMLVWTMEAAKASALDAWLISTDSVEIGEVAQNNGGGVPFLRPPELSTSEAKSVDVVIHAVEWFEDNLKFKPTHVALLQPTSPLRTWRHINTGLKLIEASGKDSLVTMNESGQPNGCLYITKRDMLLMDRRIWDWSGVMWVQTEDMPDIDDLTDFEEAERLLSRRTPL